MKLAGYTLLANAKTGGPEAYESVTEQISREVMNWLFPPPKELSAAETQQLAEIEEWTQWLFPLDDNGHSLPDPKVGTIRHYQGHDYRFAGGDAHDEDSWEKIPTVNELREKVKLLRSQSQR